MSFRREEAVMIKLTLDTDKLSEEDIANVKKLFEFTNRPDTTIHITYDFFVEYLGVVTRFNAIIDLLDKASVVEVNTQELKHNRFLAQELLCKMEQIERKYGIEYEANKEAYQDTLQKFDEGDTKYL